MVVGMMMGIGGTLAALAALRGRGSPGVAAEGVRPACGVSILLWEPTSIEGRIIDAATGGVGFSHVALDACEVDAEGTSLVIDCRPALGVTRVPLRDYGDRGVTRVWLPLVPGRELYGCIRGRVGLPYDALGVVLPKTGPVGGVVCSQLVFECMPPSLRKKVPPWPSSRPVAPNDLARGFGSVPGGKDIVL